MHSKNIDIFLDKESILISITSLPNLFNNIMSRKDIDDA
jgi:hypothetical protein